MASLPLPSHTHSNADSHTHSASSSNNSSPCCCCARPDCAVRRQNQSALHSLETDLETAARLGQVCSFLFIRKITILYIDSCIPYIYSVLPLPSAFFSFPSILIILLPGYGLIPRLHTQCYCVLLLFLCLSLESCTCLAAHHCRLMSLLYNHEFTGFPIPCSIPSLSCPSWPPPPRSLKMIPRPC